LCADQVEREALKAKLKGWDDDDDDDDDDEKQEKQKRFFECSCCIE